MAPTVPRSGPLNPSDGGVRRPAAFTGWRTGILAAGVVIAVVSLAAWGVTLGMAAGGGIAPTWIGVVALYGLPVAFVLMGVALAAAVADRRRR